MTELLQQAIDQVNVLPDSDQNTIANLMIQAIAQQQRSAIDSDRSKLLLAQLALTMPYLPLTFTLGTQSHRSKWIIGYRF